MMKFQVAFFIFVLLSCAAGSPEDGVVEETAVEAVADSTHEAVIEPLYCNEEVTVGAEQMEAYLPLLEGKRIGVVGNQSSRVGEKHLVDTLLASGVNVVKVFSPEHGFRGKADAGETVNSSVDPGTGLPIVSIYGKNKKPSAQQLADVDVLLFDIQDVGARFYTYISTLHYIMEAAAENNKSVIVLDRPNPNGHYVDGPVLKEGFSSFIGMHAVPVVHGMTVGEYAQMINGEGWLDSEENCQLEVIPCKGWDHTKFYALDIAPSPNLPNMTSIYWYPSLCFFEGTKVSLGRGTDYPFQMVGHPKYPLDSASGQFSFVPMPNEGAKHPKLEGETCFGIDLHEKDIRELRSKAQLDLSYLLDFYERLNMGASFFLKNNFINLLAGSDELKKQILNGESEEQIRASWQDDLNVFKQMRSTYLLYAE